MDGDGLKRARHVTADAVRVAKEARSLDKAISRSMMQGA